MAPEWIAKFSETTDALRGMRLQKLTATSEGELVLSTYQAGRSLNVVLSTKQGDSGLSQTKIKPPSLPTPNSFVQISRKYIQGLSIKWVYFIEKPLCCVIEFETTQQTDAPNCLILNLEDTPKSLILAQKHKEPPFRYMSQYSLSFQNENTLFFESFCEWNIQKTKTKRRAFLDHPVVCFSIVRNPQKEESISNEEVEKKSLRSDEKKTRIPTSIETIAEALSFLPSHIRKPLKTKLQFFKRKWERQIADLPTEAEINHQINLCEEISQKDIWPPNAQKAFEQLAILKRRHSELSRREQETKLKENQLQKQILNAAKELLDAMGSEDILQRFPEQTKPEKIQNYLLHKHPLPSLSYLCKMSDIPMTKTLLLSHQKKQEEDRKLPYKTYYSSSNEAIRVSKSAIDADEMIKMMPSNHIWLHVLNSEGSHIWVEKQKKKKEISSSTIREACLLAIYHSKQNKSQQADVQIAKRNDIEKKKNLPPGKVLVRKSSSMHVKYEQQELQKILNTLERPTPCAPLK